MRNRTVLNRKLAALAWLALPVLPAGLVVAAGPASAASASHVASVCAVDRGLAPFPRAPMTFRFGANRALLGAVTLTGGGPGASKVIHVVDGHDWKASVDSSAGRHTDVLFKNGRQDVRFEASVTYGDNLFLTVTACRAQ